MQGQVYLKTSQSGGASEGVTVVVFLTFLSQLCFGHAMPVLTADEFGDDRAAPVYGPTHGDDETSKVLRGAYRQHPGCKVSSAATHCHCLHTIIETSK